MKRVYITGHRGLLGSACVRRFRKNHEVITSSFDLMDERWTRYFISDNRPDYIINCAAVVGGVKANRDRPVDFLRKNLKIQDNVIAAAADYGVEKLIHVGTSCMFPKDAAIPVQESSLLTGRLEDSVEAYAVAKIAGWRLCKAYWEQYGKRFMTVNPANIYGPGDSYSPDSSHVIPSLIYKTRLAMQTGDPLRVWGDGTAVREFIHAADVASAIEIVLEKWDSPEVINIGTGIGHSIRELVDEIITVSGYDRLPIWEPGQPVGIPRKTFAADKLMALGWKANVSLRDGLKSTWEDFVNNPNPRGLKAKIGV